MSKNKAKENTKLYKLRDATDTGRTFLEIPKT